MSTVPPKDCEGYFPAPYPSDINEINFYLPVENGNSGEIAAKDNTNDATRLACSMILAPGTRRKSEHNLVSFPESIIDDVDSSKDVVIVCHGFLAWRNQMLISHTAAAIAKAMNCHTLRFDFSGNGHSDGVWRYGNCDGELNQLKQVVRFVRDTLKCRVPCVLGHSQGAGVVLDYAAWEQEQRKENPSAGGETVPCIVNMAGMFYVPTTIEKVLTIAINAIFSEYTVEKQNEMSQNGKIKYFERGETTLEIARDDAVHAAGLDTKSIISGIMDAPIAMLTIHGEADEALPVDRHARQFDASGIPNHELVIIKDADHNFSGLLHMKTIASAVRDFVQKHGGE